MIVQRAAYFAGPQSQPIDATLRMSGQRRDGRRFPAEITLNNLPVDNGLLVTAAIRDVTERLAMEAERERLRAIAERERVERRLQQSERLESLGQLVGGVAHDFNSLLNVIQGCTDFTAEEIARRAETDPQLASVLEDIGQVQAAAQQAGRLTRQLLTFARHEVRRPEVIDLNEVVGGAGQLLRRTLGEHVELTIDAEPALWRVKADRGQLEQVLVNLAVNARDAMPGGGRLTIDTGNTEVDETYASTRPGLEPGRYTRLRVSDTGTGMDRATVARVFEPFFSTKPKGRGTGLGLATVYGAVTSAGGSIEVYSELGLGTTVSVLLPVTDEDAAPEAASPSGGEGEPGHRLGGRDPPRHPGPVHVRLRPADPGHPRHPLTLLRHPRKALHRSRPPHPCPHRPHPPRPEPRLEIPAPLPASGACIMQVITCIMARVDDDAVFKALADPTRRALLDRLRERNGQTLGELCEPLAMARQSATQHLGVLEAANLIATVRSGRKRLHYLNPVPLWSIAERWIEKFERPRLRALSAIKNQAEHRAEEDTMPDRPSFVYVTYIESSPERVWEAITDPGLSARYWGHSNVSDWQPGSSWEHQRTDGSGIADVAGTVLESVPPRRLVMTFASPGEVPPSGPTKVTFDIEPFHEIIRLTVTHENLAGDDALSAVSAGWPAVFANLKSLLETGHVLPRAPWEMHAELRAAQMGRND